MKYNWGEFIKECRERLGVNQTEFAERLGSAIDDDNGNSASSEEKNKKGYRANYINQVEAGNRPAGRKLIEAAAELALKKKDAIRECLRLPEGEDIMSRQEEEDNALIKFHIAMDSHKRVRDTVIKFLNGVVPEPKRGKARPRKR